MSLFAIGDLHLSLTSGKPMDVFGGGWDNYVEKIKEGFSALEPDDVCVLCGDLSWGMTLEESMEDIRFIDALPGKKIILKGNHDYWWETVTKMKNAFAQNGIESIEILHNNCFRYGGAVICGTRGWLLETEADAAHNAKIVSRETMRLRASLEAAEDAPEKLCFLHYPPRFNEQTCPEIIAAMKDYNVTQCFYGHIHGYGHRFAFQGCADGIKYSMVSADYLGFAPKKIV